jgi:signal transduction histidine kinase/ligand-binding sensor domain-containing protein
LVYAVVGRLANNFNYKNCPDFFSLHLSMQILKCISITAWLFFCAASLAAQQYPFVHYTPKDGLVNSRVRKAYQDSKGRMYFITYGGLSVYNGAKFKNYTMQNGLLADLVNDVLEVGDDSLLVAANTCGLNVLVHGQMKKLDIAKQSCPIVNHFLKSNDGNVYATADEGLYKINSIGIQKLPVLLPPQKTSAVFLGIIAEYKDYLVFTTNDLRHYQGLFLYNKKTNSIADALPQLLVYSLKKDYSNVIWLSTDKVITVLDTTALAAGKILLRSPYASFIKTENLKPGYIDFNRQNEPLIAFADKGIVRYRKDGTTVPIALLQLSTLAMQNFFPDREDVIWVCNDGNGIYKLSNTKLQLAVSYAEESKAGIKIVQPTSPDSCWIMTNNNRLKLHSSLQNKSFSINASLPIGSFFYNEQHLYIVTNKKLFIAPVPQANNTTIKLTQILSLTDSNGFGGRFTNDPYGNTILFEHKNICVFKKDKLLFTYPISFYDLIEGMYVDRKKQLWVISRGNGMQVFSLHPENTTEYLQPKYHFLKEFENASPRCIAVDKNELLWVGNRYNGLMAFEFKNNQLIKRWHFKTDNGLTDNFITWLACDKTGNIIAGTQTGLDRLIKTNGNAYRVENITKSNNIFSYVTNVWTDAAGNAFALTNTGPVLQAEAVHQNSSYYQPQLLIEEIKINGKTITAGKTALQLNHLQRNITFSVAAPSFIDETQIKYSYLLSGSGNKEWSDTTTVADINFLNLAPGNYTLHVKAFFPSTSYTEKVIDCSFTILPPWWQTWWFRLGIGIMGIGLIVAAIRLYYRRKLEKQKTILEKQQAIEKERSRIASDIHDDLGAGLSTMRFLSEKVKRNSFSDTTKSDAEKIVLNSNELVQKMNELIWAMNEKNDTLEDLLFYARAYAAEYGEENNLQMDIFMPENIPVKMVSGELRRNVFLTIKESLHNVVKHAAAKNVVIYFNTDKNLQVSIKDNGAGFTAKNEDGNGLRNMKKRIESIGGTFEILNAEGVTVKMDIPLI